MKRIPLTQGQVALVDDEDFELFGKMRWYAQNFDGRYYAARSSGPCHKRRLVYLSRAIMGITDPRVKVDHKNHDTLDNRRKNLRPCTNAQNIRNMRGAHRDSICGLRGVSKVPGCDLWMARIGVNLNQIYLGCFKTPRSASMAYAAANRKYFGDFGGATE